MAKALDSRVVSGKAYMPSQFDNLPNPDVHRETPRSSLERYDGQVDIVVSGSAPAAPSPASARCSSARRPRCR